ncbi:MAG: response regulator [Burkholderiaceae bacterium]
MRMLLVDDHPLIHEALGVILDSQGDDVSHDSASTFDEASARLTEDPPVDLVLLDLGLPGFSGIGALTTLREQFPDQPVVVISAREEADIIHAALDAGAMGFIPKTFQPAAIRMAVRFVAAGGVFVPQQVLQSGGAGAPPLAPDRQEAADIPQPETGLVDDERLRLDLGLTPRQFDVLKLLVRGMSNKRIALILDLSDNTVKAHVAAVLRNLEVSNRTEAVVMASRRGLRAVA